MWESYFNYFSEYYPEKLWQSRLKWETKINERGHEFFLKNLVGHEIFSSMVPWATKHFWKNLEALQPPSQRLNVHSLICLKSDCCNFKAGNFFSLTNTNRQSLLSAHWLLFSTSQSNPHSKDIWSITSLKSSKK